jgi:hypothetical protein
MKNLISKFQEKLNVSKENAIFRVVMMFCFVACLIAMIVLTVINFPYDRNYPTISIAVPNSNYQVVKNITEQGVQMLDDNQFYGKLSVEDTVFVSVGSSGMAMFMFNKNGTTFYYKKEIKTGFDSYVSHSYKIEKIKVDNNILSIEKVRSAPKVFRDMIALPGLLSLLFFLFAYRTTFRKNGYGYNNNGKFGTKFLEVWI